VGSVDASEDFHRKEEARMSYDFWVIPGPSLSSSRIVSTVFGSSEGGVSAIIKAPTYFGLK
jgi:hypothetical protein